MSEILGMYGKGSPQPQAGTASSGGVKEAKPIANYSAPKGPTSINNPQSPGLHGTNHGNCGSQGK